MALSGTSSIGTQLLHDGMAPATRGLALTISRTSVVPPRRIGFYYVEAYPGGTSLVGSLVAYGVLYLPGERIPISTFGLVGTDRLRLWVAWNASGLSWALALT